MFTTSRSSTNNALVRTALAVAAASLMAGPVGAQELKGTGYIHVSWTEKDGLPGSYIGSMAQDRDGYLWLVANSVLVRFDGVRFVPTPLPRVRPSVVSPARDGSLWIGESGDGGVSRLQNGQVTSYSPQDAGVPSGLVRSVIEGHDGSIWAASPSGISRFRDGRWERLGAEVGLSSDPGYSVYADMRGDIWVGTGGGVFRRAAGSERFQLVQSTLRARGFAEDARGTMWITGLDHPFRAVDNPGVPALAPSLLQTASGGWALERDVKGNIWVATLGAGVWRVYDTESSRAPRIEHFDGSRLSSAVVRSLLEDREGNIWVGTDNGLNRLTPSTLTTQRQDVATINRPVTAVTADKQGSIWVGTQTGLYRFTERAGTRFDQRDGLPGVAIYSLHTDARGTLWIAGDQIGLVRRLEDGRFSAISLPGRPPLRIVAMTSDPSGALWLCDTDMGGVFRWKDGILTEVPEVTRVAAHSALTDRKGRVWIGLVSGILLVTPDGATRILGPAEGLGAGRVAALFEDATGVIWAGTGVGLNRYDDVKGRFITLPLRQNVTAIVQDDASNLWLGVLNGIMRINREDLDKSIADPSIPVQRTLYDMADGLHGVPIWLGFPTAARARDGHLWFVTADGLADLDPRAIHKDRLSPPVRIESIAADDRRLAANDGVALPPRTSRLEIDYTALSFTVPSKVRFRYKLEGFDSDWINAGTRRQAFYTNLPPRNYRFHVVAGNDGVWNEAGSAWAFSISPAFYQTVWFRTVCLVTIGLAAWGIWRLRVRRVREQYDLVLAERARMGREIHDTLLQSLVGVAMQFDAVGSLVDESAQAVKKELERLRRQVELCIREARQSILDLRSPVAGTEDLGTAIRQMAEKQTRGTAVGFELTVKGTPRSCSARVQQQLLRIAQEGVANAIRHAEATHIRLELLYDNGSVSLRVADNGRGFDPAKPVFRPEDHWGLANMKERADQIGAQFRLTSSPGGGTEIETVVSISPTAAAAS